MSRRIAMSGASRRFLRDPTPRPQEPSLRPKDSADVVLSIMAGLGSQFQDNTHPDTPKAGWEAGDVRGVLEVITPLDAPLAATRSGLVNTATLMVFMAAAGLLIFGLQMIALEEATKKAAALRRPAERSRETSY